MQKNLLDLDTIPTQTDHDQEEYYSLLLSFLRKQLKTDLALLQERVFELQLSENHDELYDAEEVIQEITKKTTFLNAIKNEIEFDQNVA